MVEPYNLFLIRNLILFMNPYSALLILTLGCCLHLKSLTPKSYLKAIRPDTVNVRL